MTMRSKTTEELLSSSPKRHRKRPAWTANALAEVLRLSAQGVKEEVIASMFGVQRPAISKIVRKRKRKKQLLRVLTSH